MCFSCRNNKNPQTVKLSPTSSSATLTGNFLVGRYARARRRCAQTARISLRMYTNSKSAKTQNCADRQFPSVSSPFVSSGFAGRHLRSIPPPSRFRFGEAVFTDACPDPQEENYKKMTKSLPRMKVTQDVGVSDTSGTIFARHVSEVTPLPADCVPAGPVARPTVPV